MFTSPPRCSPRWTIDALVDQADSSTSTSTTSAVPLPPSAMSNALRRPMMMPGLADVTDVDDRGVLQDRALGDELSVLHLDRGDLHGHTGVEAGCQAGADLEPEKAAAEQRIAEAIVADDLRHHVDDRLGQALRCRLGPVDLGDAVGAETGSSVVGDVAHDHGRSLRAQLACELGCLGQCAEGVLVEDARIVVQGVDQDAAHLDQLPFVKPGDDLLDRLVGVFVLDDLAGLLGRRRVDSENRGL